MAKWKTNDIRWNPEKLERDICEYVAKRVGKREQIQEIRKGRNSVNSWGTEFSVSFEKTKDGKKYLVVGVYPLKNNQNNLMCYVEQEIETGNVFSSGGGLEKLTRKKQFSSYPKRLEYEDVKESDRGIKVRYRLKKRLFELKKSSFRETICDYALKPFLDKMQRSL